MSILINRIGFFIYCWEIILIARSELQVFVLFIQFPPEANLHLNSVLITGINKRREMKSLTTKSDARLPGSSNETLMHL